MIRVSWRGFESRLGNFPFFKLKEKCPWTSGALYVSKLTANNNKLAWIAIWLLRERVKCHPASTIFCMGSIHTKVLTEKMRWESPKLQKLLTIVQFIFSAISSSQKCLRVSKTESYGLSRICFKMTCQATMPSSSGKCLRVSKTESYGLSRICFEMTRQATMPSSKA
jgi:hypothetical protein